MLHSLYRAGLFAALFGLLFVPGSAWTQPKEARPRLVNDEANLFTKETVTQVNKTVEKIKKAHGKDLCIETIESGPDKKEATSTWTKDRFNKRGIDGIYIVISKDPSYARDFVGDNTQSNGYFTTKDIEKMHELMKDGLNNKDKRDDALIRIANYVHEVMNEHALAKGKATAPKKKAADAPVAPAPAERPVANNHAKESPMPAWVGWVCLIIAVLLVVWIVFAIIRAMTSMGGGGYGYGGGYGGGGFFTGMLGGMFGAMAGMWLYNNMFGGHAYYGHDGQVNWGGGDQGAAGSGAAPYEGDTADGGQGGGVDGDDPGGNGGGVDGDAGGGDAGGGGGDWDAGGGGGGEDAGGGGGGWFGGGGDDGGGGGGGWFGGGDGGGGGGGGDWGGGGGGDFGGGGGGGDW